MKKVYCDVCTKFMYETVEGAYILDCTVSHFSKEVDVCKDCAPKITTKVGRTLYTVIEKIKNEVKQNGKR